MKYPVCTKLELSIWHDGHHVRVHLEDPLSMTEAEVSVEIGVTTLKSRAYHLREAIVISLRQVIAQAFELDMMKVNVQLLPAPSDKHTIEVKKAMLPTPLEEDIY